MKDRIGFGRMGKRRRRRPPSFERLTDQQCAALLTALGQIEPSEALRSYLAVSVGDDLEVAVLEAVAQMRRDYAAERLAETSSTPGVNDALRRALDRAQQLRDLLSGPPRGDICGLHPSWQHPYPVARMLAATAREFGPRRWS